MTCLAPTSAGSFPFTISVGPPAPPPGRPPAGPADFDANGNGFIDDTELFTAMDSWIAAVIKDDVFFKVIDAWVSQTPIRGASLASSKPMALVLYCTRGFVTFAVRVQGIVAMKVEVYDLTGRRVFSQESEGTRLTWNLSIQEGHPPSSGVYLAIATFRHKAQLIRVVKKLVILR